MLLDAKICESARQTRDARFDGHFFIGVTTTGVYCRPICPVRIPKAKNVQFYPSAAAAAEAGFRPCLRCRPESSPGTPAWNGTSVTVSRALKLIASGALNEGNVEELSETLGIGSRHLLRLFHKHLGASPLAVAQTQRLHFAKKLIDETDLPMTEIGFASGFNSVRRFNDAFQKTYGRTPSKLRKTKSGENGKSNRIHLQLRFRPPFDWKSLLNFLGTRAIPGIEVVDASCYRRTIEMEGEKGDFELRFYEEKNYLDLEIRFPDSKALFKIVERIRRLVDLGADTMEISNHLSKDQFLAPLLESFPGIRVPGAWDGFEIAVRAVLGQQITVKAATTLAGRLAKAYGEKWQSTDQDHLTLFFPTADVLSRADLTEIGLTKSRSQTIREMATAVCEGKLCFDGTVEFKTFVRQIKEIRGIGDWTAQYIGLRALGEPDAFPSTDLGLLKAGASGDEKISPKELMERSLPWRPWRAYATMYLWKAYQSATER
ncbi:MAG: DNA-3-methyladenine glycosylase 2 family protein [SAR324 cluster bacterium]|nr:DNA-3-methyladenine glycosylase 2 family protein [SAR324 cluster bacterium]